MKVDIKEKRTYKVMPYLIFIFMATLFLSIGYAAIEAIPLDIEGTINAKVQEKVFITDVQCIGNTDADVENSIIRNYEQTLLNSKIVLSNSNANSSITYMITLYNNSDSNYAFDEVKYDITTSFYDNPDIVFNIEGLERLDEIKSNSSLSFTITFSYKDKVLSSNNTLTSYLNFSFKKLYTIEYVNITNNGYPVKILEGENLNIVFTGDIPQSIEIEETNNYTYEQGALNVTNINTNLTIKKVIDLQGFEFVIAGNENPINVSSDKITSNGSTTVTNFLNMEFKGINLTDRVITKIEIKITYSSPTGSTQSITSKLVSGTINKTQQVKFNGKQNNAVATIVFDNLNIAPNQEFSISNATDKLTNSTVNISDETITAYFSE